jgi:photosystem II stability/assembly factor-like uncharacterized protein
MKLLYRSGGRLLCTLVGLLTLLAACRGGGLPATEPAALATEAPVNGFGVAANHVHAMLALPHRVLVLATHYGLFRSQDGGTTWREVAGGSNQPMDGLMAYSLGVSPVDAQRLYVLALPARQPYGVPGLYTSADGGQTWELSLAAASVPSSSLYLETPGNETAGEVYIYLPGLGAAGVRVSRDNGRHVSAVGTLPFGSLLGLLAIPGAPGCLLAYGNDGVARSTDGGAHWRALKGITGSVSDMVAADAHGPIYASGAAGIMVSSDQGVTFRVVDTKGSYVSLTVSPVQGQVLYGKTGLATYRSGDGGRTWNVLPPVKGNLAVLMVDPDNASHLYLSLSYPTAVYQLGSGGAVWQSLTPPKSG